MTSIIPAPAGSQTSTPPVSTVPTSAASPNDVITSMPGSGAAPSRQAWLDQIIEAALALVFGGGTPIAAAGTSGTRDAGVSWQVIADRAVQPDSLPSTPVTYGQVSTSSAQLGTVSRVIGPAVHIASSTLGGGPTTARPDVVSGYGAVS